MDRTFIPRYVEIEQALRERIVGLRPGTSLPSDAQLCDEFNVSRMTARQAVQSLVQEGLVQRIPGRGTFVARPPVRRQMGSLLSFSEEMRRRGLTPSSKLLSLEQASPSVTEMSQLGVTARHRVLMIRRLRLANGTPMSIERSALPPSLRSIADADLESGSLHAEMSARGRVPTLARGTLTCRPATGEEAELLQIPAHAPLLVEQRLILDQDGQPIELTETLYAGERYVFDIELHREPTAGRVVGRRGRLAQ